MRQHTDALKAETEAQAGLNPLVNDYGFALAKAQASQDLLIAAQEAGLTVTPTLKATIDELAGAYATASVESDRLAEQQDRIREAAEEWNSTARDVTSGFVSDLRSGTSAAEALANALNKVVDKLIDVGLNSIFSSGGAGGIGGFLGGIFGFAKGGVAAHGRPQPLKTFARGGVSRTAAIFGEAGPEAAVPLPDGRSIPVKLMEPSIPRRSARSQDVVTITLKDDSGRMADIADQRIETASGTIVRVAVSESNRQVMPTVARHQQQKAGGSWR